MFSCADYIGLPAPLHPRHQIDLALSGGVAGLKSYTFEPTPYDRSSKRLVVAPLSGQYVAGLRIDPRVSIRHLANIGTPAGMSTANDGQPAALLVPLGNCLRGPSLIRDRDFDFMQIRPLYQFVGLNRHHDAVQMTLNCLVTVEPSGQTFTLGSLDLDRNHPGYLVALTARTPSSSMTHEWGAPFRLSSRILTILVAVSI